MTPGRDVRPRPYWHVDAKWLTGILLLLALNVTTLALILTLVTAPQPGIALLTTTLASAYSFEGGGLDTAGDLDIVHQRIAESPNGEWQPIPGLRIVVREEDLAGKSPREVRLWFFRQLAEPIYQGGSEGLASLMTGPDAPEELESGVGPLGLISAETHARLRVALAVSGVIALVLLGLLVRFSHRFGRLGSPGCVFTLAAIPGLILLAAARGWLMQFDQATAAQAEESFTMRYTQLAVDVLPGVVDRALPVFLGLAALGAALIVLALLAAIFLRGRKESEPVP